MKTVKFQGKEYRVDDWVNYITIDVYSQIEVWKNEPTSDGTNWFGDYSKDEWYVIKGSVDMFKLKV